MDDHGIVWPGSQSGTRPTWTQALPVVQQTYTGNVASGNSRVHYGNVYHLHQLCSSQYQVGDLNEPDHAGPIGLKRKRILGDTGETPQPHNPQQTLERDLKKLGKAATEHSTSEGRQRCSEDRQMYISYTQCPDNLQRWGAL